MVILFLWAILHVSCSKEDFTKPAVVQFEFQLNMEENEGKFLKFEQGDFIFNTIEFEGERETGGDVFFVSPFDDPVVADLDQKTVNQSVDFDIPQGIYQRITITFEKEETVDEPTVRYEGIYNSAKKVDIPVIVEINLNEAIEVKAESVSGGNEIVLKEETPSTAEITLDPVFMFQLVNSRTLESADITEVDGVSTIVINENSNEVIYDRLIDRLEKSTFAVFK